MAALLAIEINDESTTFVCAEKSSTNKIRIDKVKTINNNELFIEEAIDASEDQEGSDQNSILIKKNEELLNFLPEEIDTAAAIISKNNVLYEHVELPFSDSRKIERVAPLQIQDNLPFDVDDFLIDSIVVSENENNRFEILSSLIPKNEVAENLSELSQFAIDPELLSTRAGSLVSASKLFPELSGTYAVISLSERSCSLVIFVNNQAKELREIMYSSDSSLARDIKSSLARAETDHSAIIEKVYLAEGEEKLKTLLSGFPVQLELLNTKQFIENKSDSKTDLSWTVGLFAQNIAPKEQEIEPIVNFRTGAFAYKATWKTFVAAVKEELPYFIAAAAVCFLYVISIVVAGERHLSQVESAIEQRLASANFEEALPYGLEVSSIENKIAELEEQLIDVGSIASLSPLEGLQLLSSAFDKSLDIHIDSINIRPSSIDFRGTVPDLTSVGRISTALERSPDKFCKVTIDPKGKNRAQGRFRYSADIELCI